MTVFEVAKVKAAVHGGSKFLARSRVWVGHWTRTSPPSFL